MSRFITILSVFLFSFFAFAGESGTKVDASTGNTYTWRKSDDGTTRVNGSNLNTGSMWSTTVKSNGDMSGTDSKGNSWTYNENTKTYINYGTGEMRLNGETIVEGNK